jgi:hypothetical protein
MEVLLGGIMPSDRFSDPLTGQVPKGHEYVADGPDDALELHEISTLLIRENSLHSLYNRIPRRCHSLDVCRHGKHAGL